MSTKEILKVVVPNVCEDTVQAALLVIQSIFFNDLHAPKIYLLLDVTGDAPLLSFRELRSRSGDGSKERK